MGQQELRNWVVYYKKKYKKTKDKKYLKKMKEILNDIMPFGYEGKISKISLKKTELVVKTVEECEEANELHNLSCFFDKLKHKLIVTDIETSVNSQNLLRPDVEIHFYVQRAHGTYILIRDRNEWYLKDELPF